MWCTVYREAEIKESQIEALASLRALFYTAVALGQGEIKALIQEWWRQTYPLHKVPAPNHSAVCSTRLDKLAAYAAIEGLNAAEIVELIRAEAEAISSKGGAAWQ